MPTGLPAAVRVLQRGEVIVYPTDTLYGLGARAMDRRAVARLSDVKGRPDGMPMSVAVSSLEELEPWSELSPMGRAYARRHLPGPVTLLLRASPTARRQFAVGLVSHDGTIGLRVPNHAVARELARRAGPITCTSANRHGEPPAQDLRAARATFGREVALYLSGGPPPSGRPSAIADLRGDEPRVVQRA
jgi:L-threonylcarbamoyladenylate synthase